MIGNLLFSQRENKKTSYHIKRQNDKNDKNDNESKLLPRLESGTIV